MNVLPKMIILEIFAYLQMDYFMKLKMYNKCTIHQFNKRIYLSCGWQLNLSAGLELRNVGPSCFLALSLC